MGIQKITQKITSTLSQLSSSKSATKAKELGSQIANGTNKVKNSLEGMATAGKTKIIITKAKIAARKAPSAPETTTAKLIKESLKKGAKVQEALNGAKEVIASTKMQEIPKSAAESAEIFKLASKSTIEKKLELLEKFNKQ